MISPRALLRVAEQLCELDRTRPRQAALRRAVSTAYYALFHLLVQNSAWALVGPRREIAETATRWFGHLQMAKACSYFLTGSVTEPTLAKAKGLASIPVGQHLSDVARAFRELQQARHEADYDMSSRRFTRQMTRQLVGQAEQAFTDWDAAASDPWRSVLSLLMLTGETVAKSR